MIHRTTRLTFTEPLRAAERMPLRFWETTRSIGGLLACANTGGVYPHLPEVSLMTCRAVCPSSTLE